MTAEEAKGTCDMGLACYFSLESISGAITVPMLVLSPDVPGHRKIILLEPIYNKVLLEQWLNAKVGALAGENGTS